MILMDRAAIDIEELYSLPRSSNQPYSIRLYCRQGAALIAHCQPTSGDGEVCGWYGSEASDWWFARL